MLGLVEKQSNNIARAIEALERAVQLEPSNADARHLLATTLLRAGRTRDAVAQWEKAVTLNPEHGEALYNLARALRDQDPDKAQLHLKRFQTLQEKQRITDRADTLGNFALAAASARDWPQAIAQLKEALELCADCRSRADLHKNLGLVYCRSGDLENGERELRLAFELKPVDPDVTRALEIVGALRKSSRPPQ